MNTEEYIKSRMVVFASNIDEFSIDDVLYAKDGSKVTITDKTINSIEVLIKKKSNKGIDCKQWFTMDLFNREFKLGVVE